MLESISRMELPIPQPPAQVTFNFADCENFIRLNLFIVPITVVGTSGHMMFDFLVDTGAQVSLVTPYVARSVGITPSSGQITRAHGLSNKDIALASARFSIAIDNDSFLDLGESTVTISELGGMFSTYNILGILGADAMKICTIKISYPSKFLRLAIDR